MNQPNTLSELVVSSVFANLDNTARVLVLKGALADAIAKFNDKAAQELFFHLYEAYGLKEEWDASSKIPKVAFQSRQACSRRDFRYIVMNVYPKGSIRNDDVARPQPRIMGIRKTIIEHIAHEWNGTFDEGQKKIFCFLRDIQAPADLPLLDQEANMIHSVLRNRLTFPEFTESVLRRWMRYLDEISGGVKRAWWDSDFFMLLAVARTRNGGVDTALVDIALNED